MKWHKDLTLCKDPADVVDYTLDYKQLLQSDTIDTATVTSDEVTIDSSSVSGNVVTVFVSGGNEGAIAEVKTTIVTTNSTPRTFERTFKIRIEQK
jgi:ribosomal protein S28E/S33